MLPIVGKNILSRFVSPRFTYVTLCILIVIASINIICHISIHAVVAENIDAIFISHVVKEERNELLSVTFFSLNSSDNALRLYIAEALTIFIARDYISRRRNIRHVVGRSTRKRSDYYHVLSF